MGMGNRVLAYFTERGIPKEAIPLFFTDFCLFEMGPTVYSDDFFEQMYTGMDFILATINIPISAKYYIELAKLIAQDKDNERIFKCGQFKSIGNEHHARFIQDSDINEKSYFKHLTKKGYPEVMNEITHINNIAKTSDEAYSKDQKEELLSDPEINKSWQYLKTIDQIQYAFQLYDEQGDILNFEDIYDMKIESRGEDKTRILEYLFNEFAKDYNSGNITADSFNLGKLLEFIRAVHLIHFTTDLNGRLGVFLLRFKLLMDSNQSLPLTLSSFHFTGHSISELEKEHADGLAVCEQFSMKNAKHLIGSFDENDNTFKEKLINALSGNALIACIQVNDLFCSEHNPKILAVLVQIYNKLVSQLLDSLPNKTWDESLIKHVTSFADVPSPADSLYYRLSQQKIFQELHPHYKEQLNKLMTVQESLRVDKSFDANYDAGNDCRVS